jgi:hypothetical protein
MSDAHRVAPNVLLCLALECKGQQQPADRERAFGSCERFIEIGADMLGSDKRETLSQAGFDSVAAASARP